jgi:AcrR family transcriptional regulator
MSLFEEHKAERRSRILAAARKLVAARGYEALTMRELAQVARVSVPTLYNLFGSKDAILVAEVESSVLRIAAQAPRTGDSFFQRGMAGFEFGMKIVEDQPEFFRAAMRMFLTSPGTSVMRRRIEDANIAVMAINLAAAKAAGQLADWADPPIVARHMFAQYMAAFLAWGIGDLDFPTFRLAALSGLCHLLAGVARGPFAVEAEAQLRELRTASLLQPFQEVSDAASKSRD